MAGITITRSSNTIADGIAGGTLTLTKTSSGNVQLNVTRDLSTEESNLRKFPNAYNDVASAISAQLSYNGDRTTTKGADTLFGDPTLEGLQQRMQTMLSTTFGGFIPRDLGFTTQNDGSLFFDSSVYEQKVASDHSTIEKLMGGAGGFATAIKTLVDNYTQ